MSRWILRRDDPASAPLSNAAASLVYVTRCTLHSAHIIMLIAFNRALFIFSEKYMLNIEYKSLLL